MAWRRGSPRRLRFGTAIVGDISNTLVTFPALVASRLAAVVFYELIGFKPADPDLFVDDALRRVGGVDATERVRVGPRCARAVFGGAGGAARDAPRYESGVTVPSSVHLSESREEIEFIRTGGGPWRALLEEVGSWNSAWKVPAFRPCSIWTR